MKKRYAYFHKLRIYILFIAVTIISLTCIIVNSLRLAQAGNMTSTNHAVDIFAICILSFVIVAMALIAFASGYSFKQNGFFYSLGVYFSTIPYKDICFVRYDISQEIFLLYYKVEKNGTVVDSKSGIQARFIRVNVATKYFDDIAKQLKQNCNNIIIDTIGDKKQ